MSKPPLQRSDGIVTDDYMNIALRTGYPKLVLSLIKDVLSSEKAKVFVEVVKTTLESSSTKK